MRLLKPLLTHIVVQYYTLLGPTRGCAIRVKSGIYYIPAGKTKHQIVALMTGK